MLRLSLLILPQVLALVACVLYAWTNGYHRRFFGLPKRLPGPTLIPFIGRVHDLPRQHMWMKFKEWADIYGPIYQTRMLNNDFVVISDERVANELLGKRSAIYSDRPSVPALIDSKSTDGSGEYLPLMGRNEYWLRQRKFAHSILLEAHQRSFYGFPSIEARHLLFDLVQNPDKWSPQLEDFSARVMSRLTWGSPNPSEQLKPDAWALLTTMSPAGPLNNMLTPLNWIPHSFNPWKKVEAARHSGQKEWFLRLQADIRDQMRRNEAGPSFMQKYLEAGESFGFPNDVEGAFAVGMIAVAGVFTVGGPLHTFVQAMLLFPQWLKSLQEELDTVVGDRMLELSDVPQLPLLRAVIKECLRWRPAVPTGVAHEVERDDVYEGYHIPKGARILPLEWAFTRDERVYPEPEDFLPQRWLSPKYPTYKEPLTEYPTIKGHSLFGFGRRTCQGQNLTYDMLLLGCGGIAWGFNLTKRKDAQGADIEIPWNKTNSLLIIKPDHFVFDLKPRSEMHKLEVLKNWSLAQEKDPQKTW